jgi:hypothetical protein
MCCLCLCSWACISRDAHAVINQDEDFELTWFLQWQPILLPHRPWQYAVLTWRRMQGAPPRRLVQFMLRVLQAKQQAAAEQQQQAAEQQAVLAMLASQQQQQQGVLSPGTAASIAHAAALDGLQPQVPPRVDWASAVPQAAAAVAAAAAAAGAPVGSAGGAAEPSYVPALEQTLSGTSGISAASGRSKHAVVVSPVLGSTGGAPAAAWLKGAGGTSGGAEVAGSVGSARHLNVFGSSADAPQASGASFMTRQRLQGGCPGGVDAAGLAAGIAAGVAAGMGGSGGGAAAAGAGADGAKKDQAELKAEFQGLSLFNEEVSGHGPFSSAPVDSSWSDSCSCLRTCCTVLEHHSWL